MFELQEFLVSYLIAILVQFVFFLLPLHLQNWEDDFLNVLTYCGLQLLVATVNFILIPFMLWGTHLGEGRAFTVLLVVFFLSFMRMIKMIPLEFSHPEVKEFKKKEFPAFLELLTPGRLFLLGKISNVDEDGPQRCRELREKLLRLRHAQTSKVHLLTEGEHTP